MKILAIAACLLLSTPAFAGSCVVLDYQEMKDMTADELAKAFCVAGDARSANMDDVMSNLRAGDGPKPFPAAGDNFEQCTGQMDRMERLLIAKGMSKAAIVEVCNARDREKRAATQRQPGGR